MASAWFAASDRGRHRHRRLPRRARVASAARGTPRRDPATRDCPPEPAQSALSKAPCDIGDVVAERIRPAEHVSSLIWLEGCMRIPNLSRAEGHPAESIDRRGRPYRSPRGHSGARHGDSWMSADDAGCGVPEFNSSGPPMQAPFRGWALVIRTYRPPDLADARYPPNVRSDSPVAAQVRTVVAARWACRRRPGACLRGVIRRSSCLGSPARSRSPPCHRRR